jgi:hypothetical protein
MVIDLCRGGGVGRITVEAVLRAEDVLLVPIDSGVRARPGRGVDNRLPSYAIFGGCVFVPLVEPYLRYTLHLHLFRPLSSASPSPSLSVCLPVACSLALTP